MAATSHDYEEAEIVIVGGGISGLATALALHREGIRSVVLERWESLRGTGAGIFILGNGWRALQHLGVASQLRQTAIPLHSVRDTLLDMPHQREAPITYEEGRCVQRSQLVEILAADLPSGSIRFGCKIVSVKLDSPSSFPVVELQNGSTIKCKVLIGCDGSSSLISDFLELSPKKLYPMCSVRGYTNYPRGHSFPPRFDKIKSGYLLFGRAPVNDNLVFWFLQQPFPNQESSLWKDPEWIRQMCVDRAKGFPSDVTEMIKDSDLDSLSLTRLRYKTPRDLFFRRFRKGTVTVAGDAMHVMGPFLGQGGSAGIEDAVVLGRCLAQKMHQLRVKGTSLDATVLREIGQGLDQYVRERRVRLLRLSTQTYLTGLLLRTKSALQKLGIILLFLVFFRDRIGHTKYDCGSL